MLGPVSRRSGLNLKFDAGSELDVSVAGHRRHIAERGAVGVG